MRIYRLMVAKREIVQKILEEKKTSITYSIKAKTPRQIKIGGKVWIYSMEDTPSWGVCVRIIEKHRIKNKILQDGLSDHLVLLFRLEKR